MNLLPKKQRYLIPIVIIFLILTIPIWLYESYAYAMDPLFSNNTSSGKAVKTQRPSELYIPSGYDDSDDITILAGGDYDMTCEEMGSYKVKVDEDKKVVRIIANKIQHAPESECTGNYEIYYKEYNLGPLEEGVYPVVAEGQNDLVGKLVVSNSKKSLLKQFKYPFIKDVRLSSTSKGNALLSIDALLNNSCQTITDVFIKRAGENFWEIYPKISQKSLENCTNKDFVFTKSIELGKLKKETHIFYIRSSNENAVFHIEALF